MDPQSQTQPQSSRFKQKFLVILGGICAFFLIVSVMLYFQSRSTTKPSTPTDLRRVSAQGVSIILLKGQLDYSSSVVASSDPYPLTVTNNSGLKQGVFIPSKNITIVLENGTSDTSKTILFDTPGEYEFLPSVYQTGWEIWKGKIVVTAAVTNTPVPSSTTAPSLTPIPSNTTIPSPTITQGLVGYWSFNETSGTIVSDISGNGYHGQWRGTGIHKVTDGKSGNAATFNGTDDGVVLPTIDANFSSGITFQFWRRTPYTIPSSRKLFDLFNKVYVGTNDPDTRGFGVGSSNDGRHAFALLNGNPPRSVFSLNETPPINVWKLYTFTADPQGNMKMFENGVLTTSSTYRGELPNQTTWSGGRFGHDGVYPSSGIIGDLDEIKVYNYARSDEEILRDYHAFD